MANAKKRYRPPSFRLGIAFLCLMPLPCLFAGYLYLDRTKVEPVRRSRTIEKTIKSLAERRPNNMSPNQWQSAVAWTVNLHRNSLLSAQANRVTIRSFQERLATKLSEEIDMETIHWIWDEYAKICDGGKNYQKYRDRMLEEIGNGGGNWGLAVP